MIFILTYVIIEFFDQSKIDQVISFVNQYHNEQYLSTSFCEHNNQVLSRGSFLLSGPAMGLNVLSDIIIGDTPAETLFINGYFYNAGNIIIINDGVLKMKNADFHLDGNISVLNHGKLYADSSVLRFLQDYIYQYGIGLYDSAQFYLTNSTTNYNGYPFGFSAMSFAKVEIENVVNHDWTTAMVNGRADVYLNNVDITGEWLFDGNCIARFNNVDNFLSWYFFPESSAVDFRFPEGTYVNGFFIDSTLNDVYGIGYHVEIDSSTNCMWAVIPLKGSNVTIDSSLLRVTGLLLGGSDSLAVSGLVNGLYYEDYILPISDRNLHLTNTTVQTWNLYPFDTVSLELFGSIFGELCAYGNSYVYIHNAFCDGSGGHLESSDNAFLITVQSSISADIISKGHSINIVGYCAIPWGNIWVTGASIMLLVNSIFPLDPIPSDTSLVFVLAVTGPPNGETNDTIPIIGSAWIDKGPYQPLDFDYYQVFYQALSDTNWIPISDTCDSEVRRDTLCYWNTVGLEPGNYVIRLVLKDNAGDSVDCLKLIALYESGIHNSMENSLSSLRITPNPFSDFIRIENCDYTNNSKFNCRIFDINGRLVIEKSASVCIIYTRELTPGIYFVCVDSGRQRKFEKVVKIE